MTNPAEARAAQPAPQAGRREVRARPMDVYRRLPIAQEDEKEDSFVFVEEEATKSLTRCSRADLEAGVVGNSKKQKRLNIPTPVFEDVADYRERATKTGTAQGAFSRGRRPPRALSLDVANWRATAGGSIGGPPKRALVRELEADVAEEIEYVLSVDDETWLETEFPKLAHQKAAAAAHRKSHSSHHASQDDLLYNGASNGGATLTTAAKKDDDNGDKTFQSKATRRHTTNGGSGAALHEEVPFKTPAEIRGDKAVRYLTADALEALFDVLELGTGPAPNGPVAAARAAEALTSSEPPLSGGVGARNRIPDQDRDVAVIIGQVVHSYWLWKRRKLGKPLLRRFWPKTAPTDSNPHCVFRPREKERYKLRKHRKNDVEAFRKLQHLRKDFDAARHLTQLLLNREHLKRLTLDLDRSTLRCHLATLGEDKDLPLVARDDLLEEDEEVLVFPDAPSDYYDLPDDVFKGTDDNKEAPPQSDDKDLSEKDKKAADAKKQKKKTGAYSDDKKEGDLASVDDDGDQVMRPKKKDDGVPAAKKQKTSSSGLDQQDKRDDDEAVETPQEAPPPPPPPPPPPEEKKEEKKEEASLLTKKYLGIRSAPVTAELAAALALQLEKYALPKQAPLLPVAVAVSLDDAVDVAQARPGMAPLAGGGEKDGGQQRKRQRKQKRANKADDASATDMLKGDQQKKIHHPSRPCVPARGFMDAHWWLRGPDLRRAANASGFGVLEASIVIQKTDASGPPTRISHPRRRARLGRSGRLVFDRYQYHALTINAQLLRRPGGGVSSPLDHSHHHHQQQQPPAAQSPSTPASQAGTTPQPGGGTSSAASTPRGGTNAATPAAAPTPALMTSQRTAVATVVAPPSEPPPPAVSYAGRARRALVRPAGDALHALWYDQDDDTLEVLRRDHCIDAYYAADDDDTLDDDDQDDDDFEEDDDDDDDDFDDDDHQDDDDVDQSMAPDEAAQGTDNNIDGAGPPPRDEHRPRRARMTWRIDDRDQPRCRFAALDAQPIAAAVSPARIAEIAALSDSEDEVRSLLPPSVLL